MTHPAHVFAVDDMPEVLTPLVKALVRDGYRVSPINSGELALLKAEEDPPDLILMDIRMQGLNGLEVCHRLKSSDKTRPIPVILMSAFADTREWIEGLRIGAVDYVTKPFQLDEVRARVRTQLALGQTRAALEVEKLALNDANQQLQLEIRERQRVEGELRTELQRAERSRRAILSALEDQQRAERQTAARARQQATIAALGQRALSGVPFGEFLDRLVSDVAAVLNVEMCKVLEILPGGTAARLRSGVGWPEGSVGSAEVPLGMDSQAGHTLLSIDPVIVEDLRRERRFRGPALLLEQRVVSGISTIIGSPEAPYGVLGAHTTSLRRFEDHEVLFLQGAANLIATVVQRRRIEDALDQERHLYKDLVDTQPAGIYRIRLPHNTTWAPETWRTQADACYIVELVSDRFCEIAGIPREQFEINPGSITDRIHPEDRQDFVRHNVEAANACKCFFWEGRLRKPTGDVWIRFESIPRPMFNGDVVWTGVLFDLTHSRHAAAERRQLLAAIEQAGEAVILTDPLGTILYVNPAFEVVTGYTREETIGRKPSLLKSGKHDKAFYAELWEVISNGRVFRGRIVNRRKDGTLYTEEATISPVLDAAGTIVNYVAVKRDITDHLRLEEQFRASQKMEAVGILAGGVAHDFNNLLSVILSFTRFAIGTLSEADPLWNDLMEVKSAGERAAVLTRQLLAFSRRQVLEPQALQLNQLVTNFQKMLRRLIGEHIALEIMLDPDLGLVRADPGQLEQVIMNLVVNARDAMPNGGRLTIETRNVSLDEGYASRHVAVVPGPYVMLAVSDTGCGMDAATRQRLFEPFFTTKGPGQGTGLGLSTAYGIIKQSNGNIWAYSEVGLGATFKVYLPRLLGDHEPADIAYVSQRPLTGSETILVVEDDAAVRKGTARMLVELGYRVLEASGGEEAMRIVAECAETIHLLLTDVVMPKVNGQQLADQLKAVRPATRVLYMSGYMDSAVVSRGVLERHARFISKPFGPSELGRKVRAALDDAKQPSGSMDTPQSARSNEPRDAPDMGVAEDSLIREELSTLPSELKRRLLKVATAARYEEILELLERDFGAFPTLTRAIRRKLERFDYTSILALLGANGPTNPQ